MLERPASLARAVGLCLAVGLTASCAFGPRTAHPELAVPLPDGFAQAGAEDMDAQPVASMWSAFDDAALSFLVERVRAQNRDLAQAQARVREARALRGLEVFALFPTITAAADEDRSRASTRDPFIPPDLGNTHTVRAGFDASWEIDLFGGARQLRRAARANEAATQAALVSIRLSLVAEAVQAYFAWRGEAARLQLQRRQLANLRENERVFALRYEVGRGTELELAQSRTLLRALEARVPATEAAIARHEQRLAVLAVLPLTALRERLGDGAAPLPPPPTLVSVGTPDAWVRRRPDILEAEQRLAVANAQVGVQLADFFPHLALNGSWGWTGQQWDQIGGADAHRWRWGPVLTWSFLDLGRVRQRYKAAQARAGGAIAHYQQAVLLALEETENALAQYRAANQSAQQLALALEEARKATHLARLRFDAGAIDARYWLETERSELELEDQALSAQTQRWTSLALLYKALAGDFLRRG